MGQFDRTTDALIAELEGSGYERAVEVGIGRRTDVARGLAARGVDVTATDVHPRAVPDAVRFVEDDIVNPRLEVYEGSDVIYALNTPPELHRPTLEVARRVGSDFLFTTLGADQPAVPVERVTIPGETLYVASTRTRDGSGVD